MDTLKGTNPHPKSYFELVGAERVTNPEAKTFLFEFLSNRNLSREVYNRTPEDKFDYRMVYTPERKSDSPRESIAHQINVQRTCLQSIETEKLKFGSSYDPNLKNRTKEELLKLLEEEDRKLVEVLANQSNIQKVIKVPWNQSGVSVIPMLWSLNKHEVFHNGWNLALMDHLNIPRFTALQQMWGE